MRLSAERRAGTGSPPGPPVLRVVEVAQVCVHEDPDRRRVARLREALLRDGVLRNPPVVTLLPDGRFAVLDGANRVTALQGLGIPHLVAQVVDYHSPEIILLTWRHYVAEDGPPLLRMRLSQRGDLPMEPLSSFEEAEARVGRGVAAPRGRRRAGPGPEAVSAGDPVPGREPDPAGGRGRCGHAARPVRAGEPRALPALLQGGDPRDRLRRGAVAQRDHEARHSRPRAEGQYAPGVAGRAPAPRGEAGLPRGDDPPAVAGARRALLRRAHLPLR